MYLAGRNSAAFHLDVDCYWLPPSGVARQAERYADDPDLALVQGSTIVRYLCGGCKRARNPEEARR